MKLMISKSRFQGFIPARFSQVEYETEGVKEQSFATLMICALVQSSWRSAKIRTEGVLTFK
jgi:hypothetical protein